MKQHSRLKHYRCRMVLLLGTYFILLHLTLSFLSFFLSIKHSEDPAPAHVGALNDAVALAAGPDCPVSEMFWDCLRRIKMKFCAVFNLFQCFVHFICKFYLLALSQEAVSVGQPAVAAAVHPVFVRGVSWGMMLLRCFFPIFPFSHIFFYKI